MQSRRVLVSFLGKGLPLRAKEPEARPGYVKTTYRFQDGGERSASFFGRALLDHLKDAGNPVDAWTIIGTAGSTWSTLFDDAEGDSLEELLVWGEDVEGAAATGSLDRDVLSRGERALAQAVGVASVRLELIGNCASCQEQRGFVAAIRGGLTGGETLILDVTHGFRHLPVVAAFAIEALRWLIGIRLEATYYGARDMSVDGIAPVLELATCSEAARVSAAAATLTSTGSVREAGTVFPNAKDLLEQVSFLDEVNRVAEGKSVAGRLRPQLEAIGKADPLAELLANRVVEALRWTEAGSLHNAMRQKAQFYRDTKHYSAAASLLFESILMQVERACTGKGGGQDYDEQMHSALVGALGGDCLLPGHRRIFTRLRKLRNSAVHGTRATGEYAADVMRGVSDPREFEKVLDEGFGLAGDIASGVVDLRKVCKRVRRAAKVKAGK